MNREPSMSRPTVFMLVNKFYLMFSICCERQDNTNAKNVHTQRERHGRVYVTNSHRIFVRYVCVCVCVCNCDLIVAHGQKKEEQNNNTEYK